MASTAPTYITGGCLCGKIRYRADFPKDHDFQKMSSLCMCTQCRKQSGALALHFHVVPVGSFQWMAAGGKLTPHDPDDLPPNLGDYQASPNSHRYFCKTCGGLTAWYSPAPSPELGVPEIEICAGSIDEVFLVGKKDSSGEVIPGTSSGEHLCHPECRVVWAQNEIKGVTEGIGCLWDKPVPGRWKFGTKEGVRVEGDIVKGKQGA